MEFFHWKWWLSMEKALGRTGILVKSWKLLCLFSMNGKCEIYVKVVWIHTKTKRNKKEVFEFFSMEMTAFNRLKNRNIWDYVIKLLLLVWIKNVKLIGKLYQFNSAEKKLKPVIRFNFWQRKPWFFMGKAIGRTGIILLVWNVFVCCLHAWKMWILYESPKN